MRPSLMPAPSALVVLVLAAAIASQGSAAATPPTPADLWTDLGPLSPTAIDTGNRPRLPQDGRMLQLDRAALDHALAGAVDESRAAARDGVVLHLPLPDGTLARFGVVESSIVGPDVQAMLPELRTYIAQGLDDPTATLRLQTSRFGLRAFGTTAQGALWIGTAELGDKRPDATYLSAWHHDVPADAEGFVFTAGDDLTDRIVDRVAGRAARSSGGQRHDYRLILTFTDEYMDAFAWNIGLAVNEAIATVGDVNVILERDVAIRLVLEFVALWFGVPDPFPAGDVIDIGLLEENQAVLDDLYGPDAYDVGHLLTRTGQPRGHAFIGSACLDGFKGHAASGSPDPAGDIFAIYPVTHNLAHQFGATHTFHSSTGDCLAGRFAPTAFEPGAGSTLMSYANRCAPDTIVDQVDPYLHGGTIEQILAFRDATTCQQIVAVDNEAPSVALDGDTTIPRGMPFYASAGSYDPNGDTITHCWEQIDTGADALLDGPLFRSLPPIGHHRRYFPDIQQALAGTSDPWEVISTMDRQITLRVTVRDNHAGGGGVAFEDVTVTVAGNPLRVLSPNGGESFQAGELVPVTWDPGSSQAEFVRIAVLGTGTSVPNHVVPNTGSAVIPMPCGATSSNCQVRIENSTTSGLAIRYFDASDGTFSVTDGLPDFAPATPAPWSGPVVASPEANITEQSGPLPADLFGEATTWFGLAVGNSGATGCVEPLIELSVDDRVVFATVDPVPAGEVVTYLNIEVPDITGGRHTVWQVTNPGGEAPEGDLQNNGWARQFIWTPQPLTLDVPQQRSTPPEAFAGSHWLTDPTYPNCDGVRVPAFPAPSSDGGRWGAVAILPSEPSDLYLRLHEPASDPQQGFDVPLVESASVGANSQFVLLDLDLLAGEPSDAGIIRPSDPSPYAIHSTRSQVLNTQPLTQPSSHGPFTLGESEVVGVFELDTAGLPGGSAEVEIRIENQSADVNLGVSIYDAQPAGGLYAKYDAITGQDELGPGQDEAFSPVLPTGRNLALVVWRVASPDHGRPVSFAVHLQGGNLTAVESDQALLPSVTQLESVFPNPFNPQTTARLAMSQAGRAMVAVYDVQGRRVRTLVDGHLAAGRHDLRWTGDDDSGRRVSSGVYFVRAVHPAGVDRMRVALVK